MVGECIHFVLEHEPLSSQGVNRCNVTINHSISIFPILGAFLIYIFLQTLWYICTTLLTDSLLGWIRDAQPHHSRKIINMLLTFDWTCLWILKITCKFLLLIKHLTQRLFITCRFESCFAKLRTKLDTNSVFLYCSFKKTEEHVHTYMEQVCICHDTTQDIHKANYSWNRHLAGRSYTVISSVIMGAFS
jgi:hypothetical protein